MTTPSTRDVFASVVTYLEAQPCSGTLRSLQRAVLSKGLRALEKDGHWPIVDFPLAIYQRLDGDQNGGVAIGGACALFYAFADVTDDAEDHDLDSETWASWGWEQAINTGNSLLFLALQYLYDHLPSDAAGLLASSFITSGLTMTYGQHADLLGLSGSNRSLATYLRTVEQKSGASFATYAEVAALAAGRDRKSAREFAEFGRLLGSMFQMISDLHELWGPALSSDLLNRRLSFPIALGFEQFGDLARTSFEELLAASPDQRQQELVVAFLEERGIRAYATMRIEVYRRRARELAARLGLDAEPYVIRLVEFPAFPEAGVAI